MSDVNKITEQELEDIMVHIEEEEYNIEETLAVNNYNDYFLQQALKFIKVKDEEK